MRFLLFHVKPRPGAMSRYLEIAAALRPELDQSGGCEFIDRFHLLPKQADGGWMLSFQYWRDEASMIKWRNNFVHHDAQWSGRREVFEDYRLRVGQVVQSTGNKAIDEKARKSAGSASWLILVETSAQNHPLQAFARVSRHESIYRPGRFLHVIECDSQTQALGAFPAIAHDAQIDYASVGYVDREYGMFDRAQAPQTFPEPN